MTLTAEHQQRERPLTRYFTEVFSREKQDRHHQSPLPSSIPPSSYPSKAHPTTAASSIEAPHVPGLPIAVTAADDDPPPVRSSATVPFSARTHCTATLVDESSPPDDRWPKTRTTGQMFSRASSCAVVLPLLVEAADPYA